MIITVVLGHVRYSVPEEMKPESFVGNIAIDLKLDLKKLPTRKTRVVSEKNDRYFRINMDTGVLIIKEKIDREDVCKHMPSCILPFEVVLETPLEIHSIAVEIMDINDNAPSFPAQSVTLEISESALPGARFLLEGAHDPDVGINSLNTYSLTNNKYFTLDVKIGSDGRKYAEIVLENSLDREVENEYSVILTAVDSGNPQRSGTQQIHIIILDANDNPPVFIQDIYQAKLHKNSQIGTYVITVKATDDDEGSNADIAYSFSHTLDLPPKLFEVDPKSGEVSLIGQLDYEEARFYDIAVQAKDGGGLVTHCKVIVDIIDVNDNLPRITVTSFSSPVPEDSPHGTVIAILNIHDLDSGENGQVRSVINHAFPFKLKSTLNNYFTLVTDRPLDREETPEYNITIFASDKGSPPLYSNKTIFLEISDINDNPPTFERSLFTASVMENNPPGSSIFTVMAHDPDSCENSHLSYSLVDTQYQGMPVSSYVYINSDSGVIHSVQSFDYEKLKELQIQVKAQDRGSPPLSSNATLNIFIQDQNDNAPNVLYPMQEDGSSLTEIVPRSAAAGYLVNKVVAIDADSGQNSWLTYQLLKATEPGLFTVGVHNGEVKTVRHILDKDVTKQRLVVLVMDNGQPPLSASVIFNVAVSNNLPGALSEMHAFSEESEHRTDLTFYLIIALASVSSLFLLSVVLMVSLKFCQTTHFGLIDLASATLPAIPGSYASLSYAGAEGRQIYSYEFCLASDSRKEEFP
ncbi:protocadherin gamma-A11-like [Acipenser ruthenus]|uniref:protocadherin gamma-A11-like n=1 Tax=Acipenser ruthenus TaxID=7906 RepID=UPI0027425C9A|nr:protocadherin gamma-A11-like [Acipenser ruthenus]